MGGDCIQAFNLKQQVAYDFSELVSRKQDLMFKHRAGRLNPFTFLTSLRELIGEVKLLGDYSLYLELDVQATKAESMLEELQAIYNDYAKEFNSKYRFVRIKKENSNE